MPAFWNPADWRARLRRERTAPEAVEAPTPSPQAPPRLPRSVAEAEVGNYSARNNPPVQGGEDRSVISLAAAPVQQLAEELVQRVSDQLLTRELISSSPMLGSPVVPADILAPAAEKARPASLNTGPRFPGAYKMDRPFDFVVPQAPSRRPHMPVTVEQLRQLADSYDLVRDAINEIKRQVKATPIKFVAADEDDDSEQTVRDIAEVQSYFSTSGGFGGYEEEPEDFVDELIEDLLTTGAACYWTTRTLAGAPMQTVCIDSATIRPRVTAFGWPDPGDYRYEQWIYGVQVGAFYADEMRYRGIYKVSRSPYYRSPIEWLLMQIEIGIRYDQWNLDWLTDGNTPDSFLEAPVEWSSEQFYEYVDYMDAMMSGSKQRQKAKVTPPGMKPHPNQQTQKDSQFLEGQQWILHRICAMFGVHPSAIGFDGSEYAVTQEHSSSATSTFGVGVVLSWMLKQYNYIITDVLRKPNVKAADGTVAEPDPVAKSTQFATLVSAGILTPNEARSDGYAKEPIEHGDTLFIQGTLRPIDQAVEPSAPPVTPAGAGERPPAGQPAAPAKTEKTDRTEVIIREYLGLPQYHSHVCGHGDDEEGEELRRLGDLPASS